MHITEFSFKGFLKILFHILCLHYIVNITKIKNGQSVFQLNLVQQGLIGILVYFCSLQKNKHSFTIGLVL